MRTKIPRRRALLVALALLWPATESARAGGLAVNEASPRLDGTALSGTAAWADDPSMAFYNPAGLTRLAGGGITMGLSLIDLDVDFAASKATTWGQPITGAGGSMGASGGSFVPVPSFHLAQRVAPDWVVYMGVTGPFGDQTNYDDTSVTRYVGTLSEIKTINGNPAVAWEPIPGLSLGVGFNVQYMRAHINQKFAIPTIPINPAFDVNALILADDWAFGWNAGVLWEVDDTLRFGLGYRSAIHHTLEGDAQFDLPHALDPLLPILGVHNPTLADARAGMIVPESLTLSGFWHALPWLDLMNDVQWTHWSSFQELELGFDYTNLPPNSPLGALLPASDTVYENFRNAWRATLGAQIHASDDVRLRFGSGFDGSPVYNANRTIRLPDANRILLALGLGWTVWDDVAVDFAYTHYFVSSGTLNDTNTTVDASQLAGSVSGGANVFALQLTYLWDGLPLGLGE